MKTLNKVAVMTAISAAAMPAFAAPPDVSSVVTALVELATPIGLVGAAYLGIQVTIRGWKLMRRVF